MRGVDELREVAQRPLLDRPAGHHDVPHPRRPGGLGHVVGVLVIRHRLGVRVRDRRAPQRLGHRDDVLGEQAQPVQVARRQARQARLEAQLRAARVLGLLRLALGDLPVLAVQAAEHAAAGGERKSRAAGQEMEQGLLLDRVHVERAGVAVGHRVERAVAVDLVAAVAAVARG